MYCDWPVVGRCCFCLPLRRGILGFGYANLLYNVFWVGLYSYSLHTDLGMFALYHGSSIRMSQEVCILLYCVEVVFTVVLIYGTHKQSFKYITAYYYFGITTVLMAPVLQIVDLLSGLGTYPNGIFNVLEIGPFIFAALCINIYLLIAVKSLLKKMELGRQHRLENPLQVIVYDGKLPESNGVYNEIVVPAKV